ncbi:hypothetical protein PAP_02495 [Palaeococcus pacificus DY20341]|uniref:Uncharacterized protein n=1 Tax=Palaeococcus pacificus DY20341 TaxID=1343739 RepID=A0A075LSH8_9EURY|nr:hypothetical protein [Palaeococcus pacificus]AIF68927.1 hypothetical protein PAP_02495 [Palaeococcus pacificus DY20341]
MSVMWRYVMEEDSLRFRLKEYVRSFTFIVLVVWLLKGWLDLEKYDYQLTLAIIGLIVLGELLGAGKWFGITVSSVIFALAKGAFLVAVFLFFAKYIGLNPAFEGWAGKAFAYSVVLALAGFFVGKVDVERFDIRVDKKAYAFDETELDGVILRGEGKAYPIKFGKKRVGYVIDGEVEVEAETPIGNIKRSLSSPVAVWTREELGGRKVEGDREFAKRMERLLNPNRLYRGYKRGDVVDLGIIKVYESEDFTYVKMPFLEVLETPEGSNVKIGPMKIKEGSPGIIKGEGFTIAELNNGFRLSKFGDRMTIKTEEFTLKVSPEYVKYTSGNESLTVGRKYVSLKTSDVAITVGKRKAKVSIEDIVISARDGKVKIRSGGRSYTIEDEHAFKLVLEKAKEIADEQSAELIDGLGIDKIRVAKKVKELLDELMTFIG